MTQLENYLETFPGAIMAVSHDRYFLDRVAEQIFEVRPGGEIQRYTGNYADYLKKRQPVAAPKKAVAAAPASQPAPAKPKKLKFSYMEQREYEHIDEEIANLEAKIAAQDQAIAQSGADFVALQAAMAEKEQLEAQLEQKMDRWVYLNDLAEQIAAQE